MSDTKVPDTVLRVVFYFKTCKVYDPAAISPFFKNGEIAERCF